VLQFNFDDTFSKVQFHCYSVLEKYAENWKKKKPDKALTVVYNVGGYVGKNLRIVLTTEECLPKVKLNFDKLLFSHIFSIQQNKLASLELLFNASSTGIKKSLKQCNHFSGINCDSVKERQTDQESNAEVKTTDTYTKIQKIPKVEKATVGETENKNPVSKDPEIKATASKPPAKKPIEKPAISAFFAKHLVKNVSAVEKKETVPIKVNSSTKRVVREPSDDDEEKTPVNNKRLKLVEEETSTVSHTKLKSKPKASKSQTKSKEAVKKRKRIQQVSDSETSDEEKEEVETVLDSPERPPPAVAESDEEDLIPITPNNNIQNKSKKWVTKHQVDKDGFIVTSKEFVTCDDNVEDKVVPAEEKKEVPPVKLETTKPTSPPMKKKQPSITNFFTRK